MKGEKFFIDALARIPKPIEKQVSLSMMVADRIAHILSLKHMSQKEFAKGLGRTEAEVSRWMSGTHNFTLSTIAKISSYLNEDIIK